MVSYLNDRAPSSISEIYIQVKLSSIFMADIDWLNANWLNLLTELNVNLSEGEAVFKDLVTAHSDLTRHYHNLDHVEYLLRLASVQKTIESLAVIYLAAWFHDCIYDSQRKDNEIKSAVYAKETLTRLHIAPNIVRSVRQIVLSTQKHQPLTDRIDNLVFLDLDLAILGTSGDRYAEYATAIRKEYSWLSDRDYQQGRKQVLASFLAREKIYYTDYFYQNREQQARANLARERKLLCG